MLLTMNVPSRSISMTLVLLLSTSWNFFPAACGPIPYKVLPPPVLGVVEEQQQVNEINGGLGNDDLVEDKAKDMAIELLPDQSNDAAGDGQLQQPDNGDDLRVEWAKEEPVKFHKQSWDKLSLDKLIPPDHMDVVKMEQDGHINHDYHKEMFLGGQHDEFKSDTVDHAEAKLKDIVERADRDGDGKLSLNEMEQWILGMMKEHFAEASQENDLIFKHLDPDADGFIKWKEYYVHFLLSRGFEVEKALKHVVDYDDSIALSQDDKDALISYKFRWTDADNNPTDNQLSKVEFMSFRHPEHSKRSLETMANNVMRGVDSNEDGFITSEEFAALPPGELDNQEYEEMDRKWQAERKKEFKETMDLNQNGKVDLAELKNYLDPTNPIQAKLEAESLMSLMDDSKDLSLSMDEILKHSDIFISSKLVNFAANVHDEF